MLRRVLYAMIHSLIQGKLGSYKSYCAKILYKYIYNFTWYYADSLRKDIGDAIPHAFSRYNHVEGESLSNGVKPLSGIEEMNR